MGLCVSYLAGGKGERCVSGTDEPASGGTLRDHELANENGVALEMGIIM